MLNVVSDQDFNYENICMYKDKAIKLQKQF